MIVEGSLFAINDLLIRAKSITLYFIWRMGDDFCKKSLIKKNLIFFTFNFYVTLFFTFNFSCYYAP